MTQQASTIGRYLIQQRLGQGGMGALYLARDPHIDRLVALKLLHAHLADHDVRRRFAQEARAAGALAHPNIVTIHDYGEWDGVPYIVMEYVRGETLAEVISRRLPASTDSRLRWIEEMCAGLSLAHAAGVVHRDIKPANLMIDQNGTLKILDFGIARISDASATNTTSIVGTPSYMSPEQVRGEGLDHRSDIFSAGAVLYELLSFQKAFPGQTPHTILHRVLHVDPVPLAELCTGLDARVETIVRRALEKDVSRRYAGIAEMRSALARLRAELPNTYDAVTVVAPLQPQPPPAVGRSVPTPSAPVSVGVPSSRVAQRAPETPGPRPDDTVETPGPKDDATWIVAGTAHRREAAEACRQAAAAMHRGANLVARQLLDEVVALDPLNPDARRLLGALTERSRGTAVPTGASSSKGARDADRAGAGGSRGSRHVTATWLVTGVAGALALVGLLAWVATTSNADPESPDITSIEPIGAVAPALPAAPPAVVAVQPDPATAGPPADEPQRVAPRPVVPAATRVPPSQTTLDDGASPAPTRRAPDQPRPATPTNAELERRRTEQTILESLQRAQAAESVGEYNRALEQYDRVLRLEPGHVAATRGSTRVQAERRNSADRLMRRAQQFYEVADFDRAIGDLTSALSADPSHVAARDLLDRVRKAQAADGMRRRDP